MKNETLHELIEQYLNSSLTAAKRQEFERQLASDATLRAELELHRALQEHLGDAGEQRLRLALEDVMQAPVAKSAKTVSLFSGRWLAWAAVFVLILTACLLLWQRQTPEPPALVTVPPMSSETNTTVQQPNEPPATNSSPPAQQKPRREQPIAMANPADFIPNPTLEARIGGIRGNQEIALDWLSPASGAEFVLKNSHITLPVELRIQADSAALALPIRLFVYSNRPENWANNKPSAELDFPLKHLGQDEYQLRFNTQVRLRPGLYYLVAGQLRPRDIGGGYRTLWVGSFLVIVSPE